jgi:predicted nucleic acid-binding protein
MILDTNAISALAENNKALIGLVQTAPRISVTIISLGEYFLESINPATVSNWRPGWMSFFQMSMFFSWSRKH